MQLREDDTSVTTSTRLACRDRGKNICDFFEDGTGPVRTAVTNEIEKHAGHSSHTVVGGD